MPLKFLTQVQHNDPNRQLRAETSNTTYRSIKIGPPVFAQLTLLPTPKILCFTNCVSIGSAVSGRPFVKRFALCYRTVVCLSVLSCLSVTLVYCGQTVGRIKMKLGMQVAVGPGHIVLEEDRSAPPALKGHAQPPVFGPYLLWPNGWMD